MPVTPRISAAALCAAFLTLTACNNEPETITANAADPQAEALAKAKPVELPPAIANSRTYRCKDNSLVYIDFYTNNTANVRVGSRDATAANVTAPDGTSPLTGGGYSVSANAETINLTVPGKGAQSCKA